MWCREPIRHPVGMVQRSNAKLLLKKARALQVPEEVLEKLTVETWVHKDAHHHQNGWCEAGRAARYGRVNSAMQPISVLKLVQETICKDCEQRILHGGSTSDQLVVLADLIVGADLAKSAERYVAKHDQKTDTNGRLKKLRDEIATTRSTLSRMKPAKLGTLTGLAQTIDDLMGEALETLEKLGGGEAQRKKIAGRIQNEMVPSQYRQSVTLDDTPVLVGFTGYVGHRKVEEVLDAYTIRQEEGLRVLECPRYVYDHLNRAAGMQGGYSNWLLTSATAPSDRALLEVAATLWDPSSRLGSMNAAIEAAEAATA